MDKCVEYKSVNRGVGCWHDACACVCVRACRDDNSMCVFSVPHLAAPRPASFPQKLILIHDSLKTLCLSLLAHMYRHTEEPSAHIYNLKIIVSQGSRSPHVCLPGFVDC